MGIELDAKLQLKFVISIQVDTLKKSFFYEHLWMKHKFYYFYKTYSLNLYKYQTHYFSINR